MEGTPKQQSIQLFFYTFEQKVERLQEVRKSFARRGEHTVKPSWFVPIPEQTPDVLEL
jgi:hypothetical protein